MQPLHCKTKIAEWDYVLFHLTAKADEEKQIHWNMCVLVLVYTSGIPQIFHS